MHMAKSLLSVRKVSLLSKGTLIRKEQSRETQLHITIGINASCDSKQLSKIVQGAMGQFLRGSYVVLS